MENSNFLNVNWKDVLNGLINAVYGGVIGFLYEALIAKGEITWENVVYAAIVAGVGYLSKEFTTTSEGKVLGIWKKD